MNAALLLLILISANGCAHRYTIESADTSIERLNAEGELGRAIHHQIMSHFHVFRDLKLNQYVQQVGSLIADQAGRRDLRYEFAILEDERIYATHAPGGYVYLTTGMLHFLTNEIELAGVLAHEIGALQYRDPRFSSAKKTMELLAKTGSAVGPAFGPIGALSALGLVAVDQMVGREKDRDRRISDADKLALGYLVKAEYDPQGLVDLLARLYQGVPAQKPYLYDYLESHPVTPERMEYVNQAFKGLVLPTARLEAGRDRYLTALQSLQA